MGLFGIFGKKKDSDNGGFLKFDNYPFKLLVIQVLMYDKKLLKPEYLGGDQFFEKNPDLDELSEKEAISRLEKHIKSANEYFQSLKIPCSMAKEITSLYSGDELDVYYNINPQWQDYDEYFEDGKMFDFHLTQVYSDIVPGGGEAFFEDFDDFYFDIPFYNEYNPSQGQTVMQPQPSEEQLRQQREEMWRQNILENAIDFEDMQSEYFNNPIKAEKKYTVGEEILLKIRIDKIEYYSYDDYTYIMSWLGRFTIDAFLYSNDKSFEELDYPQIVWVKAKYNSRHEAWDNKVTYQFTDAQLLLWKKPGLFE